MAKIILESTLIRLEGGYLKTEITPADACWWFYECEGCHTVLRPKTGHCCVFCPYGAVPCPSVQTGNPTAVTELP